MRSRTRRRRCSRRTRRPRTSEDSPIDLAARALRHRDRSRRQIDERLAKAGIAEDARADALDTLERVGYVDDTRYAAARAETLAARGYGDEAIRQLLTGDGLEPEAAEAAVEALAPEGERAVDLAARFGPTPKAAAALQRKGFGRDALEAAFPSLFANGGAGA